MMTKHIVVQHRLHRFAYLVIRIIYAINYDLLMLFYRSI